MSFEMLIVIYVWNVGFGVRTAIVHLYIFPLAFTIYLTTVHLYLHSHNAVTRGLSQ